MANLWDDLEKEALNPRKPNAPGVISDISRATGQFVSGVGSTLRDLGAEQFGAGVERYGSDVVLRNPSQVKSFQDILDNPFTTLREAVSEVVPQVGLAIGGQLAGRAVGGLVGAPLGPLGVLAGQQVGGVVGGLLPIAAQTYGGIRSEQRAKGIEDIPRAIGATVPAALLERMGGAERIAGRIAGEGTQFLAREAGQRATPFVARQFARGGLEEAITEVPQSALERYGAYAPVTGPEATDEYAVAATKAFLGGGAIRGGLSAFAGQRPAPGEAIDLTGERPTAAEPMGPTPELVGPQLSGFEGPMPAVRELAGFDPYAAIEARAAAGQPMSQREQEQLLSSFFAAQQAGEQYTDLLAGRQRGLQAAQAVGERYQRMIGQRGDQLLQAQDVGLQARPIVAGLQTAADLEAARIAAAQQAGAGAQALPGMVAGAGTAGDFRRIMDPNVMQPIEPAPAAPAARTSLLPTQAPFSNIRMDRPGEVPMVEGPTSRLEDRPAAEAAAPVVSPPSGAPAVSPAAPAAAGGVLPAAPAAPTQQVDIDAEADQAATAQAQAAIDELGLRPLAGGGQANLQASVRGGNIGVTGKASFGAKVLASAKNAFIRGVGKEPKTESGKLAQAARAFGEAYRKYLNAAGNLTPSESKVTLKPTKTFPMRGDQAQAEARAGANVAKVRELWQAAQNALSDLGAAAGNNAKNVEVMIRLIKDDINARKAELDRQMEALDEMQADTERESNVTIEEELGGRAAEIAAEIKALEQLDLGLSQGWAAAKRGIFRGDTNMLDVRGGEIRTSKEEQQQGFEQPLERAAKYGAAVGPRSPQQTGFQGVLNYIRSKGTPFERLIAKAVSDVFKNTKNPPTLVFAEGTPGFDPTNNTVTMSPTASPEVALHEALHAALQWYVHSNPKNPLVRNLVKAVDKVVKYDSTKLSEKAAAVQKVLADLKRDKRDLDAVLELISYGNTLAEFRKALEAMPTRGTPTSFVQAAKDVWNMILATVRNMLNVPQSVASDVIMDSFKLLEEASRAQYTPVGGTKLEASVDTSTSAFRRWFGGSQVVDARGAPLVVYHGSKADIDTFQAGTGVTKAIYFTTSPELASTYATDYARGEGAPAVYPVYLSAKKLLNITAGQASAGGVIGRVARLFSPGARARDVAESELRARLQSGMFISAEDIAALKRLGYDGVYSEKIHGKSAPVYAVFDANQIKSAVGNKGTYNPAKGNILEAAVTSESQALETSAQEAGYADASQFAKGPGAFKTPTQLVFETIGLGRVNGKDLRLTRSIKAAGAEAADWVRQNAPTVERVILNFNSRFSNGPLMNKLIEAFKYDQNTGYLQMEKIAQHLAAHPELAKPFLSFMDGDAKALDGAKNSEGLKAIATNLRNLMDRYIQSLPANSAERRAFERVPFSQYLLHPKSIGQVAGTKFGVKTLAGILGTKTRGEASIDDFKQFLATDENGDVVLDDPLYQLFEDKLGQTVPAGFISKAKYAEMGNAPAGYKVDTTQVWKFSQFKEGEYKFTSSMTAKQAAEALKTDELSAALLNTTAALAHTYASQNFLGGLLNLGRVDGKATAQSVAFDSVEDVNRVFGTGEGARKISEDKVLKVSDEASRSPQIRWQTQRTGTWVQLPDSDNYGPLAGKLVPGPVWNSMLDMHDRSPLLNAKAFNNTMTFFKKSKTVYNPGTHVTNILSNVTLATMHGISFRTLGQAAKMFVQFETNPNGMREQDRALVQAFYDSGAVLGQFASSEVKQTVYDKLNQAISPDSDSSYLTKLKTFANYEKNKARIARYDNLVTDIYAAEDNVFRFAAFLNTAGNIQLRDGTRTMTKAQMEEAGLASRKMFLDYDIDARAIRALRQSFLPFVSWSYAIMPVLGRMAIEKPWAIANVLMAYALMSAAMEGDDEEEMRKAAPDYLRDRAWGGLGPYMHLRIPFVGDAENPVYFNLGKYIPMFTLFQPPPGEAKLAGQEWVPGFATPSGPFVTIISALNGYDPFTGKPMHDPTDTQWDKLVQTGKAMYDTMAPAAVNSKFWSNISDLSQGVTGPTGVEKSAMFLARNLGGLGLYQFNVDESRFYQDGEVKKIEREFSAAMNKAKRREMSKGYPDYEALDEELDVLAKRLEQRIAEIRGETPPEE